VITGLIALVPLLIDTLSTLQALTQGEPNLWTQSNPQMQVLCRSAATAVVLHQAVLFIQHHRKWLVMSCYSVFSCISPSPVWFGKACFTRKCGCGLQTLPLPVLFTASRLQQIMTREDLQHCRRMVALQCMYRHVLQSQHVSDPQALPLQKVAACLWLLPLQTFYESGSLRQQAYSTISRRCCTLRQRHWQQPTLCSNVLNAVQAALKSELMKALVEEQNKSVVHKVGLEPTWLPAGCG